MMKFLLPLLFVIVAINCMPSDDNAFLEKWKEFKAKFDKVYVNEEEESYRMNVFKDTLKTIEAHNTRYETGEVFFTLGINQFADLTHEEYIKTYLGFKPSGTEHIGIYVTPPNVTIPDSIDWRKSGAVTPVKDQKTCGSCWAFSATGAIEGQLFKKTGKLVSLSEQNLIDCTTDNNGCDGGQMTTAFQYVHDNGGIDTEDSYLYENSDGKCRYNSANSAGTVTGYKMIKYGSEDDLKSIVGTIGPVSISIDASLCSFKCYNGSVYHDPKCSSHKLNHGVLVVGYGTDEKAGDFWIVKNSWGPHWGLQGYMKLARNKNNLCGVTTNASYPTV